MKPPTINPAQTLAAALEKIPPHLISRALSEALVATSVSRSGAVEPDTRSRLAAAQMILDRVLGKPIERQQVVSAQVGCPDGDLIERMVHSPALRSAIRNLLEAAEKRRMDGG